MLLQLIRQLLTLLLLQVFSPTKVHLLLSKILQVALLLHVASVFLIVLSFDVIVLLAKQFLLPFSSNLLFIRLIQLNLQLS